MNKQLDVQILGQSYILGCPEGGEERLLSAVRKVDEAMCKIRDAGKIKARDRIAVLAALNLAFEQPEAPAAAPAPVADTESNENPNALQARLNQLLARLDNVLEQDGQLI
jgi:cell division protein ZapA